MGRALDTTTVARLGAIKVHGGYSRKSGIIKLFDQINCLPKRVDLHVCCIRPTEPVRKLVKGPTKHNFKAFVANKERRWYEAEHSLTLASPPIHAAYHLP